jgi:serine/threonine protein kinase
VIARDIVGRVPGTGPIGPAHPNPKDPFGLVGMVLDGQFRVDKFVGEGGFSIVYRGFHSGLDVPIAIKCLKLPSTLGSALVESFVQRFRDESRLQYRLSQGNLNIARSVASGTTMSPITSALVPYMVLEWLEGRSLANEFEVRRAYGDKGRTVQEVVALLDSAVDALAYAHAQGVIHRDINPGNLFLATTRDGVKMKVLDFGVAKIVSDHSLAMGPRAQTMGHIRIFAPAYGAPEQFDDKLGIAGAWTDVYALALIALEAMTDRQIVDGEHLGEFANKTLDSENRPSPRREGVNVGDAVEEIFKKALSLLPSDRFRDVGEFWGALKNAIKRDASPEPTPETTRDPIAVKTLAMAERPKSWRASSRDSAPPTRQNFDLPPMTMRMANRPPSGPPAGSALPPAQSPSQGSIRTNAALWPHPPSPTPPPAVVGESIPINADAPVVAIQNAPTGSNPFLTAAIVVLALVVLAAVGTAAYLAVRKAHTPPPPAVGMVDVRVTSCLRS